MAEPVLTVEIAFTTSPFSTPSWTDVSAYVLHVSTRRGKATVLASEQAGTCTVTLDNSDQRFDPNNTSSPYSPNVLPMRRVRVTALYNAVTYGLFSGFIESWPQPYMGIDVAETAVSATDGFKILNLQKLSATYAQQLSSARATAVLDSVSWPAADRSIDTGQSTIQAATLVDDNPLSHLLTVADSESGLFFVDRSGNARFISRHGLIGGVIDTANYTFGDGAGEKAYSDIEIDYDDADIWNDVRVSSQGVATQTATDATSQTAYLVRTLTKSALLLTSTSEQQQYANFLLASYKDPALRVERVSFSNVDFWDRVMDRDLGSKVVVTRDPPGSGNTISQSSYVEGIGWDISPNGWRCTWNLVALTRRAGFWVLGASTQSVLGSTTRLAY